MSERVAERLALSWVQVMPLGDSWWVPWAARAAGGGNQWGRNEGGGAGDKLGHGKGPTWPMLACRDGRGFVPSQGCDAQCSSEELGCVGKPQCPHGYLMGGIPAASSALAWSAGGFGSASAAPEVSTVSAQELGNKWG